MSMREEVVIPEAGSESKVKEPKTSGGRRTTVRHTIRVSIPPGIVIFLVKYCVLKLEFITSLKIRI